MNLYFVVKKVVKFFIIKIPRYLYRKICKTFAYLYRKICKTFAYLYRKICKTIASIFSSLFVFIKKNILLKIKCIYLKKLDSLSKFLIKIYSLIYFNFTQNYFSKALSSLSKDTQLFVISRDGIGAYLILLHYISCWQKARGKTAIAFVYTKNYIEPFNVLTKYICPDTIILQYPSKIRKYEHLLPFELLAKIFNKLVGIICAQRPNSIQLFMPFNFDPIISPYQPFFDTDLEKHKTKYSPGFLKAYIEMRMRYDVNYDAMLDSFKLFYENNSYIPPEKLNEKLKILLNNLKINKKYVVLNINTKDYCCDNGNARRITSLKKYDALIDFLINQNFQVVIQGRRDSNPLNLTPKMNLIEYDNSEFCSIENDLALYYGAEFAIANKSGPLLFAIACNIPLLVLDYVEWPANHAFKKLRFYPKPIKHISSNKYMSWKTLLNHPGFFNHHIFQNDFEDYIYEDMSTHETIDSLKEFISLLNQPDEVWIKPTDLQNEFLNELHPLHMELYHAKVIPCHTYLEKYYKK